MKQAKLDIQFKFYQIIRNELSVLDFEKWLYDTPEIEEYLGNDFYMDLLNINYKSKYALNELENLIYVKIPFGEFEKIRLEALLEGIVNKKCDLADTLSEMYDDYCDGYTFLRYLGLSFILNGIDEVPILKDKLNWNEQAFYDKRQVLDKISEDMENEARRILAFIKSNEIVITNRYEYEDKRKYEDRVEINDLEKMYQKPKKKRFLFFNKQ